MEKNFGDLRDCFAASDFLIPRKACKFEVTKGASEQRAPFYNVI